MNIDKAMSETRRYFVLVGGPDAFTIGTNLPYVPFLSLYPDTFKTRAEAQAVCDRLNLRAVLEAIRGFGGPFAPDYEMVIDAIVEEVGK